MKKVKIFRYAQNLSILIFMFTVLSCSSGNKKNGPLSTEKPLAAVGPEEVILKAYAKKNKVFVILNNNLKKQLNITPLDFALIKEKQLIKFDHSIALFELPLGTINPGFSINGWITFFKEKEDLTGYKLVFNNPGHKPIFTVIEAYQDAPPADVK